MNDIILKSILSLSTSILVALIFSLNAQQLDNNNTSDNGKLELSLIDSYNLSEKKFLLDQPEAIFVTNIDSLFFLTKEGILVYSNRGQAQQKYGRSGRGPFEFEDPVILKNDKDFLYIWDAGQRKLSKLGKGGKKIDEFRSFRWAMQDFVVSGDTVFFFNSGRNSGKYIEPYSLTKKEFMSRKYGELNETHKLLKVYDKSGGITADQKFVYYVSPSELNIHRINKKDGKEEIFVFNDEEFVVPEIKNARSVMSKGQQEFTKILMNTSILMDISIIRNFVVLRAHIGELSFDRKYGYPSPENKKVRFYIFDRSNMKLIDTFTFSFVHGQKVQYDKWASSDNLLVFFSQQFESQNSIQNDSDAKYSVNFFELRNK